MNKKLWVVLCGAFFLFGCASTKAPNPKDWDKPLKIVCYRGFVAVVNEPQGEAMVSDIPCGMGKGQET